MTLKVCESTVEPATLEWFEGLGYNVLSGPQIAPGEPDEGDAGAPRFLGASTWVAPFTVLQVAAVRRAKECETNQTSGSRSVARDAGWVG